MKLFWYLHNGKKHKKEKELKKNINFKRVFEIFSISYFSYFSFVLMLLESIQSKNLLPLFYPLPLFLITVAILVVIDDRRTVTNYCLQAEIQRIKYLYQIRKKTEEVFDGK